MTRWPRATLVLVLPALVAGVAIDRCAADAGRPEALASAHRIWIAEPPEPPVAEAPDREAGLSVAPIRDAFWAIRDLELDADELEMGARGARLVLLGDPEVLVHWNGILVHSARYRVGDPATVLDVSSLLEPRNRIVLEARSATGAGGLMAALWLRSPADGGESAPLLVTDGSWRTTRAFDGALLRGLVSLDAPSADRAVLGSARAWEHLDLGRWQPLRIAEEVTSPSWPSGRLERLGARDVRVHEGGPKPRPGEPSPWPEGLVVDFGTIVHGCLTVGDGQLAPRRYYLADAPEAFAAVHGPTEYARSMGLGPTFAEDWILPLRGAPRWVDAAPRRFRTVFLAGLPGGLPDAGSAAVWVQPCAGSPGAGDRDPHRLLAGLTSGSAGAR